MNLIHILQSTAWRVLFPSMHFFGIRQSYFIQTHILFYAIV